VFALQPVLLHAAPPRPGQSPPKGMHGYDVSLVPEMKAIFFAEGPDLKRGLRIDEFQNIHIYPLIAHILGLSTPANLDGQLSVLAPILKSASLP
jgi:alkaline phosphatase D